jgi:hypothetical protein
MHRSRQPRFPIGIQPRTFCIAEDILKKLNYRGPVALSCDDSKLLASFRPYFDKERDGFFLIGHFGEEYQLADPEAFLKVIVENSLVKATKVHN